MSKNKKNKSLILSIVFLILLCAVTYYVIFDNFDIGAIMDIISNADWLFIGIGFAMIFVYLFSYGYVSKVVLNIKNEKISIFHGFIYACTDFYFSGITPSATGGQPLVIYYMTKDGVPGSVATLFTFVHTTVYKIVLFIINFFSLIFFFDVWADCGGVFISLWFLGFALCSCVVVIAIITMINRNITLKVGNKCIGLGCRLHIIKNREKAGKKLSDFVNEYQEAASELKKSPLLLIKVFFGVSIQRVAYFSVAFLVYRSFGNTEFGYFYFLAIQAFIALAVDSLPLPGGMGANEAAMIMLYDSTFGKETATSAMLVIRFVNYYFGLIVSAVVTMINHLRHSVKNGKEA